MGKAAAAKGVVSKRNACAAVVARSLATTNNHLAVVALVANVTVTLGSKGRAVAFHGGGRAGAVVVAGIVEARILRLAKFADEHWHSVVILLAPTLVGIANVDASALVVAGIGRRTTACPCRDARRRQHFQHNRLWN